MRFPFFPFPAFTDLRAIEDKKELFLCASENSCELERHMQCKRKKDKPRSNSPVPPPVVAQRDAQKKKDEDKKK